MYLIHTLNIDTKINAYIKYNSFLKLTLITESDFPKEEKSSGYLNSLDFFRVMQQSQFHNVSALRASCTVLRAVYGT